MAMSRSLGALLLASALSIRSSPELMSSRPAIMLSVVVLPHPDGPTRMQNSPSSISRLRSRPAMAPSGYCLVTCSRVMAATEVSPFLSVGELALDGAGGEAGDDAALEEQH